ncbi:MAG: hypothetical protein ABSF69_26310 [Polyangiaceae bacterium]
MAIRLGAGIRWGAVALLVLAAGTAAAQNGTAPSAQVGFEAHPRLSLQDELVQSNAIIARIDQAAGVVRRQLDAARQARDVVKSLCLSDKLSQVDVAGRSTKDRQASLQAAVQRGDTELANHEFTIMSVLRQRVEQLTAEANQCLGAEVAFTGQTQIITEINPNLPGTGEDNTEFPPLGAPPAIVTTPPPCTSCVL